MSSIAFGKLKSAQEVAAKLRHSDAAERKIHKHSNQDIDTRLTDNNTMLKDMDYKGALAYYHGRVNEIDTQGNKNKRKDRVTCFELVITFPCVVKAAWKACEKTIMDFLTEQYDEKNIVNAYTHYDEIHNYYDHGAVKESRPHVHAFIIPEINGQLNGKKFSSRSKMMSMNKALDDKFIREMGIHFLAHSEPRHRTVEELKQASYEELTKAVNTMESQLKELRGELAKHEAVKDLVDIYDDIYEHEVSRQRLHAIAR